MEIEIRGMHRCLSCARCRVMERWNCYHHYHEKGRFDILSTSSWNLNLRSILGVGEPNEWGSVDMITSVVRVELPSPHGVHKGIMSGSVETGHGVND